MKKILISDIVVSNRYRKEMGDIPSLAEDIKKEGLINPITVSEDNVLIAGGRRLEALKLNQEQYTYANVVTLVDDGHLLRLEFSENENRKEFTLSEKTEMLKVLTPQVGGYREPLVPKETNGSMQNERRKELAKAVGFTSKAEAARAKTIQRQCVPEIVKLVDENKIKITPAAEVIAKMPEEDQLKIAKTVEEGKDWKNWKLHKQLQKALEEKRITKEDAEVFNDIIGKNPKKYTWDKVNSMINNRSRTIKRLKHDRKKRIQKEEDKAEKENWTTVELSTENLTQSMHNVLEFLGWENSKKLKTAIDGAVRRKRDAVK